MPLFRKKRDHVSADSVLYSAATAPQGKALPFGDEFASFLLAAFTPEPIYETQVVASAPPQGDALPAFEVVGMALMKTLERKDMQSFTEVMNVGLSMLMRWPQEF